MSSRTFDRVNTKVFWLAKSTLDQKTGSSQIGTAELELTLQLELEPQVLGLYYRQKLSCDKQDFVTKQSKFLSNFPIGRTHKHPPQFMHYHP